MAEAREGQAQALDKLLDAKKAELERLDRTIEQRRGHGTDARVLARADGHHCAVTFENRSASRASAGFGRCVTTR